MMDSETPSTALTMPSSVGKVTAGASLQQRLGHAVLPRRRPCDASVVPDPWIEERVQDVHDQVGDTTKNAAMSVMIARSRRGRAADRLDRVLADPGDVEDGLGDDGAAEEAGEVEAEDR